MRGSRLLHVGDGDQSHLVAPLRLLELPADRGQVAPLRIDVVLGGQHVEIALGDSGDQVLLGGLIVRLGLGHLRVGPLQGHPVLPAEQVLGQIDAILMGGRVTRPLKG